MSLPTAIRVLVVENGNKKLNLWLPMFLIWPLALLVIFILSPLFVIVGLYVWITSKRNPLRRVKAFFDLACALKGLEVEVYEPQTEIRIIVN